MSNFDEKKSRISDLGINSRSRTGAKGYDSFDRVVGNRPFKINQIVRHIGTGVKLVVIGYGREQVKCRKPDLSADYFYIYELEEIKEDDNK